MKKNDLIDIDDFDVVEESLFDDDSEDLSENDSIKLSDGLVGKCLVYIGKDGNEVYNKSVVYITESSKDFVKGIMINKLLFGSAAIECAAKGNVGKNDKQQIYDDLYQGGPENPAHGYVIFPKTEHETKDPNAEVLGDIMVSTSFGVLQEILDGEGPARKIIAMGHCVWHKGELEWQIFNNQWLVVPSDLKLMFDTSFENRWQMAKDMSGIVLENFIPQIGLA